MKRMSMKTNSSVILLTPRLKIGAKVRFKIINPTVPFLLVTVLQPPLCTVLGAHLGTGHGGSRGGPQRPSRSRPCPPQGCAEAADPAAGIGVGRERNGTWSHSSTAAKRLRKERAIFMGFFFFFKR